MPNAWNNKDRYWVYWHALPEQPIYVLMREAYFFAKLGYRVVNATTSMELRAPEMKGLDRLA